MRQHYRTMSSIALVGLFLFGCSTVDIISPKANDLITTKNRVITIRLDKDADPGTFNAMIEPNSMYYREDITALFEPKPFRAGDTLRALMPPLKWLHPDGPFNHELSVEARWQGGGSKPFGATKKGIIYNAQRIAFSSNAIEMKEGQTLTAEVVLAEAPYEPLNITLTPSGQTPRIISLNSAGAGEPATVVVPNNDRRMSFSVKAINAGEAFVVATASGYEFGQLKVTVSK